MEISGYLGIRQLLSSFKGKIVTTWGLVIVENALLAIIPLFIGFAIDGLLEQALQPLWMLMGLFLALILISVVRRLYDTRAYGTIKVILACEFERRNVELAVSKRNARVNLTTELVDFLEQELPALLTSIIQLLAAVAVLWSISTGLGMAAITLLVVMMLCYACFHRYFFNINSALNEQMEKQIDVLSKGSPRGVVAHFKRLRQHEVKLSDAEAIVYGVIFLFISGFVCFNLWQAVSVSGISSGGLFTVISYSWEFAESAIMLPMALQSWSRLSEITKRINQPHKLETQEG